MQDSNFLKDNPAENRYFREAVKWTLIGLAIRLMLMPFTMHGQDLVFINYFPMMFVQEGIWDPYGFITANFPQSAFTYYGPVLFIVMSIANFIIIKVFNPASLIAILELSGTMIGRHFTTADYVNAFSGLNLFRNLFLMKSPYLIFDFLIGGILFKLAASAKAALGAYKLWMLNIVVLHSVYAVGGAYLIPALFIILALYAGVKKKPYLAVVLLSLGGATKILPYMLILPACLLLGGKWREKFSLLFTAGAATLLLYLPFYLSSGNSFLDFFMLSGNVQYAGPARMALAAVFIALYAFLSVNAAKDSHAPNPEKKLLYYFAMVIFLSYALFPVRFRYFIFVTPLLALIIPGHKKFGIFTISIILMLAFQWLTHRNLQLGLFAPVNPGYFLNIPAIQEIAGRFVNVEIIYKVIARILPLTFFAAAWWIWRIRTGEAANMKGTISC
jgi:hypothetical protein